MVLPNRTVAASAVDDAVFTTAPDVVEFSFSDKDRLPGTYYYRVRTLNGVNTMSDPSTPVRVDFRLESLSNAISNFSVYPDPFDSNKGSTNISYSLRNPGDTELKIYDGFGGLVRKMHFNSSNEGGIAGSNMVQWDGKTDSGKSVSQGVYIINLEANGDKKKWKVAVWH